MDNSNNNIKYLNYRLADSIRLNNIHNLPKDLLQNIDNILLLYGGCNKNTLYWELSEKLFNDYKGSNDILISPCS